MLTITNAERIFIDGNNERTGPLHISAGIVAAEAAPVPAGSIPTSGVTAPSDGEVLDATGCVVTPGLVNAHHHLLQSAFRTLPGTRGVAMSEWLPTMAKAYGTATIDPELAGLAAAAGAAEGLLCGVTTVADHHLSWARAADTVAIASASAEAVRRVGARLAFVRGTAGDDPQTAATSTEDIVAALMPGATGGTSGDGMLQLAVGPAGVHSDGPETYKLLGEVARRHGLRRRTQSNEQVDVGIALERYGRRPLELLDDWGWLEDDVTLAHLCDVTPGEISRIAASGATATHAPGCDLPMGWGIAPVAALLDAGVNVGLGTSGGGSNDAGHLLADARLAMQIAPLVGRAVSAREVLSMSTEGSARGLGRPELGHLRAGAAGDLCVWDVSGITDAGVADPVAGILWASPGRRPRHVVVAGRVVVRDFRLVGADEHDLVIALHRRVGR